MQQDARILSKFSSLEQLFSAYEQKMYVVAFAILHDEGQAEDAVMAAFERIVRSGNVPVDASSLQAKRLMLRVVKQTSIDQYRKNMREQAFSTEMNPDALEGLAAPTTNQTEGASEEPTDAQETAHEGFEALIASLTAPYQAVLRERFGADKTVRETAQCLNISEANVRKRQSRAIGKLREEYEGSI